MTFRLVLYFKLVKNIPFRLLIKSGLCLLFLLFSSTIFSQKALKTKIDFAVKDQSVAAALWQLSEASSVPISFSDNLFDPKLRASHSFTDTPIKTILESILAPTSARFVYTNGQVLIVKKTIRRFTLSGYVEDAETGERLIGANVLDLQSQRGTSSNEYGFFSLSLPAEKYQIQFSYLGYRSHTQPVDLTQNQPIKISLQPNLTLEAIIVRATDDLPSGGASKVASEELPLEQMDVLPTLGGEVDVLRSLQQLPGVQSGTDGIGGLHVRGGNSDQNLILFDGVPVYNPYHSLGLYSIFDFDMVHKVRYFRGQFPARFGGRVSSVVDVRTRQGNNRNYEARASIGLIASKIAVEGPLSKNKSAFYLSARRSHLDPFIKSYTKKERSQAGETGFANYSFGEIIAKVDYATSSKNHLYLSFYKGGDLYQNENRFTERAGPLQRVYEDEQQLQWGNTLSVLRWNHQFNEKVFANFTGTFSTFNFQSNDRFQDSLSGNDANAYSYFQRDIYQSKIEDLSAKIDLDVVPNPQHYLRMGFHLTRHFFQPGAITTQSDDFFPGNNLSDSLKNINAIEASVYLEEEWVIHPRLLLNAGVYTSLFSVQQKKYLLAEPRLALYWQPAKAWRFHFSFSRMNQYLHLLTRSGAGFPTDLWVPSTAKVAPQQALIFDLGAKWQLGEQWSLASSAYHKEMRQLISYSEGANFNINSDIISANNWEEKIITGQGRSRGIECLLKKEKGTVQGWLSYTLSETNRQFDDLNKGIPFPFRFDHRHVFNAVAAWQIAPKWQFSSSWTYSTGSRTNLTLNEWEYIDQNGNPISFYYDFGDKNSFQLPAYHRLDWNFHYQKQKNWGSWSLHLGVYNTYNRRNIYYIKTDYNPLTDQLGYKSVSIVPILPYFRLTIQL